MYSKTWQTRGSGNKYKAVKQNYGGYIFDSKKEARKAWELDQLVKSKQIKSYQKQVKEELFGQNGTRVCNYFCDFLIIHNDDTKEYLEIKSKITATAIFRLKFKLLEDKYKDQIKQSLVKLTIEY